MSRIQLATVAFLMFPLLGAALPEDTYDLTPRFETDQVLETRMAAALFFELDEATA